MSGGGAEGRGESVLGRLHAQRGAHCGALCHDRDHDLSGYRESDT